MDVQRRCRETGSAFLRDKLKNFVRKSGKGFAWLGRV